MSHIIIILFRYQQASDTEGVSKSRDVVAALVVAGDVISDVTRQMIFQHPLTKIMVTLLLPRLNLLVLPVLNVSRF